MRQLLSGFVLLLMLRPAGSEAVGQENPLPRLPSKRAYPGLSVEKEGRWTGL